VDPDQLAAIGFCFGGTASLKLAYNQPGLKGAVSFHGGLIAPEPDELANLKSKILILHGADDPVTPQDTIDKMKTALEKGKKDWQMILYSGAVHRFPILLQARMSLQALPTIPWLPNAHGNI